LCDYFIDCFFCKIMPQFDEIFHINSYITTLFSIFFTVFGDSEESSDDYEQEDWDFVANDRPLASHEYAGLFAIANIYISNLVDFMNSLDWEHYVSLIPLLNVEFERVRFVTMTLIDLENQIIHKYYETFYNLVHGFILSSVLVSFFLSRMPEKVLYISNFSIKVLFSKRSRYGTLFNFEPKFFRKANAYAAVLPFEGFVEQIDDLYLSFLQNIPNVANIPLLSYKDYDFLAKEFDDEMDRLRFPIYFIDDHLSAEDYENVDLMEEGMYDDFFIHTWYSY